MLPSDTIAAIASPPGRAARAILRVSGPATLELLARVLLAPVAAAGAHRVRLLLADHQLPALLALWRAPRSYTADDAAELLVPGNPVLAERVLDALVSTGLARRAGPGEFTARAYLAGRLTLEQASGVAELIAAETDDDLAAARAVLSGAEGERLRAAAEDLASLLALVESGIDFADEEDVVAIDAARARGRVRALIDALGVPARSHAEPAPVEPLVALVGPPNAGKSTLFNALLGRRRAVTSDSPGTTRDALIEPLDLAPDAPWGGRVLLADLPGLDADAPGEVALAAQAAARDHLARAHALVWCDPTGRFESALLGADPLERGPGEAPPPCVRVRTKADLPAGAAPTDALEVCALDGHNLGALRRAIADAAAGSRRAVSPGAARRAAATASARARLADALALADDAELLADALRAALDSLGEVTGRVTPDDVLGRIFAAFCIGK